MERFFCSNVTCQRTFATRSSRDRHKRVFHESSNKRKYVCRYKCGRKYTRKDSNQKHEKTCLNNVNIVVGHGVNQQHYVESAENSVMTLINSAHDDNYQVYRKHMNARKNFQDKLRYAIMNDVVKLIKDKKKCKICNYIKR